jgi:hypothetical protein
MKLLDEGLLDLDDPVSKFIPLFGEGEKAGITLRHLLNHTSGLPAYRALYQCCTSPTQALDSVFMTPLVASPGDSTIYSDLGMITLGKVVESVSGRRSMSIPDRLSSSLSGCGTQCSALPMNEGSRLHQPSWTLSGERGSFKVRCMMRTPACFMVFPDTQDCFPPHPISQCSCRC